MTKCKCTSLWIKACVLNDTSPVWVGWSEPAYLGEVAHYVEAFGVVLGHDIEEEGICVVVQGLVIQEALGQ